MQVSRPRIRGRFIFLLLGAVALGLTAPDVPVADPPQPPLKRTDGRIYEVRVSVQNQNRSLGWPLILQSNWCQIASDSFAVINQKSQ